MKKRLFLPLLFVAVMLLCASCGKGDVYQERKEIPNYTWARIEKGNTIVFDAIDIKKENETYDISLLVRHTPWINEDKIKILMKIISPSGTSRQSTHEINLKSRDGKGWAGEALGDLIDVEEVCKKYITLSEKGKYTIEITNLGTKYETVGLMELGLRIVKSDLEIKGSR